MDRPNSRLAPAMIAAASILLLILATYVGGYFLGSDVAREMGMIGRTFGPEWQCVIYDPLARLEAKLTGTPVYLCNGAGLAHPIHVP